MQIGDLDQKAIERELRGAGVAIDFGLARVRVRAEVTGFGAALQLLYAHFPFEHARGFFEVSASLARGRGLRRYIRPQLHFVVDGERPFEPFPADTHLPLFEWGVNFCVAHRCNHLLLLHAGAVERDGAGVLLPALPGTGKSTLTAALALRGFRLFSDEFGAVRLADGAMVPAPRPIALKNDSIELMRRFCSDAAFGPTFPRTRKGIVAHLAPPAASVARRHEPVRPRLIVFPRFARGSALKIETITRSRAFVKLSTNSFNYELLGPASFESVGRLVQECACYSLVYDDLEAAVRAIGDLVASETRDEHSVGAGQRLPH